MIHTARSLAFRDLVEGLRKAKEAKLVNERVSGDLRLYCYAPACVYDRQWNNITLAARGLIIDVVRECIVATPFPKFFNMGEGDESIPDLAFDVLEKLDGSLIIIYYNQGVWRCATKGSFDSEQAKAANSWLSSRDLSALKPGNTYLAEWISPANRIVVSYERDELVLLACYDECGFEPAYPILQIIADQLGWRLATRHHFSSIADLVAHTATLPATEEGFVLRFTNGLRLKVKGDEYRRIHAWISRCCPLDIWESMRAGDDLEMIKRQVPDEYMNDIDRIIGILENQLALLLEKVRNVAVSVAALSDKEVGLKLQSFDEEVRRFLFPYRKQNGNILSGRSRDVVFRAIRPNGNVLPGYVPSYAMSRLAEESL